MLLPCRTWKFREGFEKVTEEVRGREFLSCSCFAVVHLALITIMVFMSGRWIRPISHWLRYCNLWCWPYFTSSYVLLLLDLNRVQTSGPQGVHSTVPVGMQRIMCRNLTHTQNVFYSHPMIHKQTQCAL